MKSCNKRFAERDLSVLGKAEHNPLGSRLADNSPSQAVKATCRAQQGRGLVPPQGALAPVTDVQFTESSRKRVTHLRAIRG